MFLFATQSVFAEYTCDISASDYYAIYEKDVFTCSSGQYLPANSLGCVTCPNGFTCNGGTYEFDSNEFQGLDFRTIPTTQLSNVCANNFPSYLLAVYEPNEHTCSAGYYLPANVDECTICPAGSACSGGTYTFNETTDQGIQSCSGVTVPAGFAICTPHRLHIGNDVVYVRSTKLTTPSLNIDIDNDGVADFFVNMTTIRTRMNKDSEHYFHAQWENNDYYICDDTTCPQ